MCTYNKNSIGSKILNLRDRHTHEYLMLSQLYTNTFLSTNTLRSDCPGPTASTADESTTRIDKKKSSPENCTFFLPNHFHLTIVSKP